MRLFPILLFLAVICSACGPKVVFSDEKDLPATGWAYADTARFEFTIPDTETAYDFVLHVGHSTDFPNQNFYVNVYTGFPSGKRSAQQLSLQLAGNYGEWLGDCSGENCQEDITFLRNARFEAAGNYYLTVEQNSREAELGGVSSIGFSVVEAE